GTSGNLESYLEHEGQSRGRLDAASSLSVAVTAKIEEGNIKAALRILCSEDMPAPDNSDTVSKLRDIHPSPAVSDFTHSITPLPCTTFQASEADVIKAIRSFPSGSSGGPDGIRPQH